MATYGDVANTSLALQAPQQAILKHFERTMRRSAALVEAAQRAPDLQTDPQGKYIKPAGMSEREFNIALHALQPQRNAPLYLVEAFRNYELAQKLAADAGNGAESKEARTVVLVVEKPRYNRVRVEAERDQNAIEVEATVVEPAK